LPGEKCGLSNEFLGNMASVLQESQRGEPEAIKRRELALRGIPLLGTMGQTEEYENI
jgi:hypothetical protein